MNSRQARIHKNITSCRNWFRGDGRPWVHCQAEYVVAVLAIAK